MPASCLKLNIDYRSVIVHPLARAGYYPGGSQVSLKLLFSPSDGRILGAQAVGQEGVDKRIDVLATALQAGMTVYDLERLELAYAPPFSSARDPVNLLGMAAANIMRGDVAAVEWDRVEVLQKDGALILDVRTPDEVKAGIIPGSMHIPVDELRQRWSELECRADAWAQGSRLLRQRAALLHRLPYPQGVVGMAMSIT